MRKNEPGRGEIGQSITERDIHKETATLTTQGWFWLTTEDGGHFDTPPPLHCEATALAVKPKQNALTTPLFSLVPFLFFLSLFLLPSSGEILVKVPFHH